MTFSKTPPELIDFIGNAVKFLPCESKRMFGAMAYFVNGNMFAGAHQDVLFLRLNEEDQKKLMAEFDEVSHFEPMPGKRMKEYVAIPESVFYGSDMMERWVGVSYGYAKGLKRKVKTGAKRKSAG